MRMWLGLLAVGLTWAIVNAAPADPPAGVEVLNGQSNFRWRRVTAPIAFADAAGPATAPADSRKAKPALSPDPEDAPPPADWAGAEFDDSAWPRVRPGAENVTDGEAVTLGAFRVCLRGRFDVKDPAAVGELTLPELRFEGGLAVYLNGREVARGFLPEGRLEANAAATAYPDEAWLTADGRPIPADKGHLSKEVAQQLAAREAARTRRLGPIRLPADALHRGINVLAIDLRRSPALPQAWRQWQPIKFEPRSLTLRASGAGVVANTSRPQGLCVWVEDLNDRITARDWADPCDGPGTLRIVGARNGSFGGTVVVSSTAPLTGVKVALSELKAVKGDAVIPAASAELFSARPDGRAYERTEWFDGLAPGVPAEAPVLQIKRYGQKPIDDAAMLPVYVRLNVPRDAAPGEYRGAVSVTANGEHVALPAEVYVAPWAVPDPKDYRTYVGLYESPTSVALHYKVDEWSEPHWKLLDKSFALLARAGNKMVNLCLVDRTQFGNDDGMLYWVRKADGTYDYDFTVFDRSVALAKKHFGTLDYVALQIWHSGGWETRKADQENTVTVLDPATGKREHVQVPAFDSDEAREFWKPVLAACRDHLAKAGLGQAMCIGILSDGTAPSAVFKMFDEIWPGGGPARWTRGLHTQAESLKPYRADRGGGVVVLHEHCYGSPMFTVGDPLVGLATFRGAPVTAYFRFSGFETLCTVNGYRLLADNAIFLRKQGLGRIGFDFWDVVPSRRDADSERTIYNRFPQSSCAQRAPALYKLCWPGPEGAETTQRFEVFCEGLQETEAMLAISAGLDKGGLGKEAADRCRRVLYDRLWFLNTRPILSVRWNTMENHLNHFGWQDLARRTFDAAAEASGPPVGH